MSAHTRHRSLCAHLCLSVFSVFVLCLRSPAQAQQPDILHRVDAHYNHLKTLRTHYTETYAGLGMHRQESGTLTLAKPGRMRWAYDQPPGKLFLLDGKFAWFYTPGDPQAQRLPAKEMDDLRTPLRFLLGHTRLQKELDAIAVTPTPPGFHIAGIPRGMASRIHQLTLDVTPTGQITAMKLEEVDGATTAFTFTNMTEDQPVPATDFRFNPPPGVTIVNATPPI